MNAEQRARAKALVGPALTEWLHENQDAREKAHADEMADLRAELKTVKEQTTARMHDLMGGRAAAPRVESTPSKRIADFMRAAHFGKDDHERAHRYAEEKGLDPIVVKQLSSNIGTEGAYTVGENLSSDIIELRRAASAVMSAGPVILPLDGGNLSIPKITGGSTSSFVGENTASNASQQTLGQVKLSAKKQVTKVPASNELLRRSSVSADAMIANEITAGAAQRRDQAYIRDNGTADTP
ncbi:MAG TPA: phage major capsid protein, partial [Polyangia bacterium]|nr:phage major capsid protein [Polyangia bacterium]